MDISWIGTRTRSHAGMVRLRGQGMVFQALGSTMFIAMNRFKVARGAEDSFDVILPCPPHASQILL